MGTVGLSIHTCSILFSSTTYVSDLETLCFLLVWCHSDVFYAHSLNHHYPAASTETEKKQFPTFCFSSLGKIMWFQPVSHDTVAVFVLYGTVICQQLDINTRATGAESANKSKRTLMKETEKKVRKWRDVKRDKSNWLLLARKSSEKRKDGVLN